jgi:hypothetical protein
MNNREALRVARDQERADNERRARADEQEKRRETAERRAMQRQIEDEIRVILPLLERVNYAGAETVNCSRPARFRRSTSYRTREFKRAGWRIYSEETSTSTSAGMETGLRVVYLLADGHIAVSGRHLTVPEFLHPHSWSSDVYFRIRPHVIQGLADLRTKLEAAVRSLEGEEARG